MALQNNDTQHHVGQFMTVCVTLQKPNILNNNKWNIQQTVVNNNILQSVIQLNVMLPKKKL
jgi:hypothetical protein